MFRIARRQPPAAWQPFHLSPLIPAMGNTTGGAGFVAGDMQNVNPLLGPLQKNGWAAATQALAPTSPTLDAIPASGADCLAVDQRIVSRPLGTGCDIGAFEYQPVTPTIQAAQASATGERVIFTGTGFQNSMTITLDGAPLAITVAADGKSFTVAAPAHVAGAVPLIVTNPGAGHSVNNTLTYMTPRAVNAAKSTAGSGTSPNALPATRSADASAVGSPNPLSPSR